MQIQQEIPFYEEFEFPSSHVENNNGFVTKFENELENFMNCASQNKQVLQENDDIFQEISTDDQVSPDNFFECDNQNKWVQKDYDNDDFLSLSFQPKQEKPFETYQQQPVEVKQEENLLKNKEFQAQLDFLRQFQQEKLEKQKHQQQQISQLLSQPLFQIPSLNSQQQQQQQQLAQQQVTPKIEESFEFKKQRKVTLNYKNQLASSETKNVPATVGNVLLNKLKEKLPENKDIQNLPKVKNIQDLKKIFLVSREVQKLCLRFLQSGAMMSYIASSTRIKQKRLIVKYMDIIIEGCVDPEHFGCFKKYEN